jgi:hypothetical protein
MRSGKRTNDTRTDQRKNDLGLDFNVRWLEARLGEDFRVGRYRAAAGMEEIKRRRRLRDGGNEEDRGSNGSGKDRNGEDGKDGQDGQDRQDGDDGGNGKDGRGGKGKGKGRCRLLTPR